MGFLLGFDYVPHLKERLLKLFLPFTFSSHTVLVELFSPLQTTC